MKKLPIGVQSFRTLVEDGYLYVDKTKDIFNLFSGKYYFLSRPRRFGKSLLISTLKEIFCGNKELFKGLWIYDKLKWETHPVIYFDFLGLKTNTEKQLTQSLEFLVNQNAETYGIKLKEKGYDLRFKELIRKLSKINKIAILVDEYDKPIIDHVESLDVAKRNRDILKTFYGTVKGADDYLEFVFITGVSKFSKVSIFSDLNNLKDITVSAAFSTMLGYTQKELLHYFSDWFDQAGGDKKQLAGDIKDWYNGYSWDGKNFVCNPFSILNYFQEGQFGNYWFATGTPTFLIKLIKENNIDVKRFENYETSKFIFDSSDIERINVFSLLFQTGYLTVKEVRELSRTQSVYRFSYPNKEVKESLLDYLAADFTGKFPDEIGYLVGKLQESIINNRIDAFVATLKTIFASVPYDIFIQEREAYYHTVIYLVLMLLGISIKVEVGTNIGRIDGVIETDSHIFVLEFKLGKAEVALGQIKEKKYYEKFLASSKKISLVGIGFNPDEKNIGDYLIEEQVNRTQGEKG